MRHLRELFTGLFDDASMFPPADTKMPAATRAHARHRLSWYAGTVGLFVCNVHRVAQLAAQVEQLGMEPIEVAVVMPEGVLDAAQVVRAATRQHCVRVRAVEVPLKTARLSDARRALEPLLGDGMLCYLELPVPAIDDRQVHELSSAGIRLKLRTGGTSIDAFSSEKELAVPIAMSAAERLPFKCTAGLHNAVRHRDSETMFEHHGFLNVALAARVAAATGNVAATAAALAERDPNVVADRVRELSEQDVTAIRAMFVSFGTCSIDEPVADLIAMGLVQAP